MTNQPADGPVPATPLHLWITGVIGALWSSMGALDFVMTLTRNEDWMSGFTAAQLEFFYGIPGWTVVAWGIGVWGGVVGCLLLLARRAWAAPVLLASLLGMAITTVRNYLFANALEVSGDPASLVFTAVIFAVCVFLWLYARWMTQRGILR